MNIAIIFTVLFKFLAYDLWYIKRKSLTDSQEAVLYFLITLYTYITLELDQIDDPKIGMNETGNLGMPCRVSKST